MKEKSRIEQDGEFMYSTTVSGSSTTAVQEFTYSNIRSWCTACGRVCAAVLKVHVQQYESSYVAVHKERLYIHMYIRVYQDGEFNSFTGVEVQLV
jgi:hypothetical protein